ncbi:restriction endonuclease [Marinomonas balearica]|uniref:Restriction endonuclease n=1 Tax=Marinomonas balearica TaxID=491947 RepID=A0A4R6M6B7_9GAMM|nr:restriction endonuclease [Marinomonas balearica]TDO95579.1 restriction endonuclease [Marinomonas balearica]
MIDDPYPEKWQDLQLGVRRIFRNVGLSADVEVDLVTPRGLVNVDVLAIDGQSVDKIKYIVECKNWGKTIPQSVVHSFTTVMGETGANIGFIISKHGLQSGAKEYTRNTNIVGLTYLEFQQRYFEAWWKRYFCPRIGDAADRVLQYTEEFNRYRDKEYNKLPPEKKKEFDHLRSQYMVHSMTFSMFNFPTLSSKLNTGTLLDVPSDLEGFKKNVLSSIAPGIEWHCTTFRGLLGIILEFLQDVEAEFNSLFGGYIFDIEPVSGVGEEGPPIEDECL